MSPESRPSQVEGCHPPPRRLAARLAVPVLFALLSLLLYAGVLHGPFIFDDDVNITADPAITGARLTPAGILQAAFSGFNKGRPVPRITFILQYRLHKKNTLPYHLFNVGLHAACGILLYYFLLATLRLAAPGQDQATARLVAFFASLLWLVHPLQTQTVSYIVQRMNGMAALFYLLSLHLYISGRRALGKRRLLCFAGCAASAALAFGSKQWTATLPFFIFLYEWFFFRGLDRTWFLKKMIWIGAAVLLVLLLAALYFNFDVAYYLLTPYKEFRDFTMSQRVLTELRVVIFYLGLFILPLPSRLNLEHDYPLSHGFFTPPATALCLALIIGALAWAVFSARRQRVLSFCVLWYFGNLVIESSIIPLELVFEHRLYLPSMFLCVFVVWIALSLLKNRRLAVAVLCLCAVFLSWGTLARNVLWASDVALYEDCVKKSPQKARPRLMLGWLYTTKNRFAEALPYLEKAVDKDPKNSIGLYHLGLTLDRLGRTDEAMVMYQKTLAVDPAYASAHVNLANIYTKQGRLDKAMKEAQAALALEPKNERAHLNTGQIYMRMGDIRRAVGHFEKAVSINPGYAKARNNLGIALARLGQYGPAQAQLEEALRLDPNDAVTHFNLGRICMDQGNKQAAALHFARAMALDGRMASAVGNMVN